MNSQLFNIFQQRADTLHVHLKNQNEELANANAVLVEEVKQLKKQIEDLTSQSEFYFKLFQQEKKFRLQGVEQTDAQMERKRQRTDEETTNAPKRHRGEVVILHLEISKERVRPFYKWITEHVNWSWGCVPQTRYLMIEIMQRFLPREIRDKFIYVGFVEQWREVSEDTMVVSFKVLKEAETEFVEWVRKNLF